MFPRLPWHNLRKASVLVKVYAVEKGLTYAKFGFVSGNKEVLGVLEEVAGHVKVFANVANVEARLTVEKKMRRNEKERMMGFDGKA